MPGRSSWLVPSTAGKPLVEEKGGTDEKPEEEPEPAPDIKGLEEGASAEGEEERAGHGLFARVRPLILDGKTWTFLGAEKKGNRTRTVPSPASRLWFWAIILASLLYVALLSWWSPFTSDTYHHALTGMEHRFPSLWSGNAVWRPRPGIPG
ncbi:MAG: hypothetical protein ACLSUW_05905 [Akkermansia sp.]